MHGICRQHPRRLRVHQPLLVQGLTAHGSPLRACLPQAVALVALVSQHLKALLTGHADLQAAVNHQGQLVRQNAQLLDQVGSAGAFVRARHVCVRVCVCVHVCCGTLGLADVSVRACGCLDDAQLLGLARSVVECCRALWGIYAEGICLALVDPYGIRSRCSQQPRCACTACTTRCCASAPAPPLTGHEQRVYPQRCELSHTYFPTGLAAPARVVAVCASMQLSSLEPQHEHAKALVADLQAQVRTRASACCLPTRASACCLRARASAFCLCTPASACCLHMRTSACCHMYTCPSACCRMCTCPSACCHIRTCPSACCLYRQCARPS